MPVVLILAATLLQAPAPEAHEPSFTAQSSADARKAYHRLWLIERVNAGWEPLSILDDPVDQCPNEVIYTPGAGAILSCPRLPCNYPGGGTGECVKVANGLNPQVQYCACKVAGENPPSQPGYCHIYFFIYNGADSAHCSAGTCPPDQTCPEGTSY